MMRLIFNSGTNAGTEISTAAALLRFGSDTEQNDIVVPAAAQRHCLLQRSPRGLYVLEDLGSQEGTLVNGQKVQNLGRPTAIYLSAGDTFQIADTEIQIAEGRARLMVTSGQRAGFEMPLDEHPVTIGRAPDNVLDFEEPDVSVYHAALLSLPTGFTIQDNGSTNGTFVNNHRIERHVLTDGDVITVGSNDLRFLVEAPEVEVEKRGVGIANAPQGESALQLVFVAGPHQGITVPIVDDQLTFGRRQDATVTLEDVQVSGMHCGITKLENELHLTDMGSTNGTILNGVRISETVKINPGDLIEIGTSVIELRVHGGVITEAGLTTAMTTVIAEGAYEVASQPKFVIDGHVESSHEITFGRAPSSSILIDGRGVSSTHAVIKWEDGFYLEDKSTYGTYLNDKRVVRDKLFTGHVIRIGEHMFDVHVRGERCTIDKIDRATAMAAIEVHREAAVDLAQAVPDHDNSSRGTGNAYKTVFSLDLPDVDAMIQERKAKFQEGAPVWRPSTDINQGSVGKVAVLSSLIAAVAVGGILLGTAQADALINHPLSEAHASKAFVDQADELGIDSGCAACHTAGNGVPESKCLTCHEGFEGVRSAHDGDAVDGKEPPGSTCIACHTEHQGLPRKNAHGASTMLGAGRTCAVAGCHPNQHSEDFLRSGPPPPVVLKAGPVPTFDLGQAEFHAAHAQVETGGETVSVGCTACHATAGEGGELSEGSAGKSCFRCHEGGEQHVNSQCSSCHRDEHGAADLEQLPDDHEMMAAAVTAPSSGRSLLVGGALALAAFLPLAGLAVFLRLRRRQRTMEVVHHIHQFPVQTVKRLVHSINTDKCVGCSLCVQACPASVLELVNHKSTIVNFDACIQCKKCEDACAFDALRMHEADKPPPMIKMPDVDNNYETSVDGMYLIGQAAGTPQVKNAINLGRAVVGHMTNLGGLTPGMGHQRGASCDVIIIGSGPGGLSAAASAARAGLSYMVLEKQRAFSWTIRSYYHKGKPVMAEPNDVEMMGDIQHWDTVREDLLNAWEQSIQQYGIQLQYQANVTDVKKNGDVFEVVVSDAKGNPQSSYTSLRVVLAIGTMGNPRKLGCPGDDHEKVANALVDPDEFQGKNILVVGGTDSAIEVVLALCETNRVWLSVRSAKFDRVKPKNLEKVEKVIAEGKCTALFATVMKEVTDTTCTLEYKADKRQEQIPNDFVFAMIGGHPPTKFLEGIGIPYVEKPHSWSPPKTDELVRQMFGG